MQQQPSIAEFGAKETAEPATAAAITRAGGVIANGGLVAFPTETVYGLGADATNSAAVARIFAVKGRPSFNPLIVHVRDAGHAARYAEFCPWAEELAACFWPGPLTFVLKGRDASPICDLVTAGLSTVAIRSPAHPVARALLAAAERPIAAPSANRSGRVSATAAIDVVEEFGGAIDLILADGKTRHGVESTIVDLSGPAPILLRPGAITAEDIERVIGRIERAVGDSNRPSAPGQLSRHYAPATPLRLDAIAAEDGEALLAFGPDPFAGRRAAAVLNLSETGSLIEAASNLFAMLRRLDRDRHTRIAVMPIPETGLGVAINDRLRRAATSDTTP